MSFSYITTKYLVTVMEKRDMSETPNGGEAATHGAPSPPPPAPSTPKWPSNSLNFIISELRQQRRLALPLVAMNLICFTKINITTAFLGRQGELQLAGGTLGITFGNITGFCVLNGLSSAMEPICGQAYGSKNTKLLHKTLFMAILLLLLTTLPISILWLYVDKILILMGQEEDLSHIANKFLLYLLPHLAVNSFLCPLKAYLTAQNVTLPIMFSSIVGIALHVPTNILLSRAKGADGIAVAVWVSDLIVATLLSFYVWVLEKEKGGRWGDGGWWDQTRHDWKEFLKLSAPCCLTTSLEWWCYEILILLTGKLPNARRNVGVLAILLNFDYILYSVMISLGTSASTRISNELGADRASAAKQAAYASLAVSIFMGLLGGMVTVAVRCFWGRLFARDEGILRGVRRGMLLMGLMEVVNFPLTVTGGMVRGTARPLLSLYANLGGFYLLALPVGVVLAFKLTLGLDGLLIGYLTGICVCLLILFLFLSRISWAEEATKAQALASRGQVY